MRKLIGLSAVACLTSTPGAPNTPTLTPDDCVFIAQYDALNDYTFASDFAFMAHHTEEIERSVYQERALEKRLLDIDISLFVEGNFEQIDALNLGIRDFYIITRDFSPLKVTARRFGEVNIQTGGTLPILLVDYENIELFSDFFRSFGWEKSVHNLERIVQPSSTCMAAKWPWTTVSEAVDVYINAEYHNNPMQIASCMREEAYNSLGLFADPQGDQSLFSDPLWRGEPSEIEGDFGYGYRDELMLKMLYRPEFENGQSYAETQAEVGEIIATECAG
ncbi:hypothetical protein FHS89_000962 [Rubricella aquisinus]|uniref:Uncharacterized protein n=1 Tax=Rubricella aquisinus TaxID=2028108 RepID=A0A840WZ71_9RHOB|nr:DUF2927 domain-containing protein [Rubricella aquisinus]MBB5514956.1 hypothetical protein [Rubricella aquisinus]